MSFKSNISKLICGIIASLIIAAILTSASAIVDVSVLKSTVSDQNSDIKEIRQDVKTILMYIGKCQ